MPTLGMNFDSDPSVFSFAGPSGRWFFWTHLFWNYGHEKYRECYDLFATVEAGRHGFMMIGLEWPRLCIDSIQILGRAVFVSYDCIHRNICFLDVINNSA